MAEARSTVSLSYHSDASSMLIGYKPQRWRNPELHERCGIPDMIKLKETFRLAYQGKMGPTEFRNILRQQLNSDFDDDEFKLLFMKINTDRTGEIDWNELVSHLIMGYFSNDPENQRGGMQLPIMGFPLVLRSRHRNPITRICFCPSVLKDRTLDPMQGNYVTVSQDGRINWWTLDMHYLRSGYSTCPHLKVRNTWVTDMVCMPDIGIVVTSSTERDLRFYDCTAGTFSLKIIISSWDYMICTMHYHFNTDEKENSLLICGDVGGNIRLLTFSPIARGPFRNEAGKPLIQLTHKDLVKHPNVLPELHLLEFNQVHPEWVRKVSYYVSLSCIVSCATCPDSLLMRDIRGSKTNNMFRVEKGVQCFAFDEESHVLATGGPDCTVRVWSTFVTNKPNAVLHGHHAGIVDIVLQDKGNTIYSLGRDRTIKVWDAYVQNCLQTFIDIPAVVGSNVAISAAYNKVTREYVLAAMKIAVITLDEQLNCAHTDGSTHTRGVAVVLYNPLFKVLLTCGMDSIVICWNPSNGKRNSMIRDAHTRILNGESIPVEITAACFDPGYQQLLTGARNGTLKVWNFNTGLCLRNMNIEHMCEVTKVFWTEGRIMAVGWNRHVTEFEDTGSSSTGKSWEIRHTDDILTAAARAPVCLVTCSYNTEMIMWKMETGQPFRQFSCTEPMQRIKMTFKRHAINRTTSQSSLRRRSAGIKMPNKGNQKSGIIDQATAIKKAEARRDSVVSMPTRDITMRPLAIHAMIFLPTRPVNMHIAALFVAVENGKIQCWSDHTAGGFKGSFQAVHTAGDYVSAMATDANNDYLFTGTTVGYIKVWLMSNYLINKEVHVNMPKLRLEFPFLWNDRVEGRAKRAVRSQPLPLLLNSYRAHLRCITSLAYIDDLKLVVSGSSDYSVRVWRLSGVYIQTLGSIVPWSPDKIRFPPDVQKVASSTTLKVWRNGEVSRYTPGQLEVDKLKDITQRELDNKTYGTVPSRPLLGHYFGLPRKPEVQEDIILDTTLQTIPIYAHLRMATSQPVKRPPTPELVRQTRLKRLSSKKTHFGGSSGALPHEEKETK